MKLWCAEFWLGSKVISRLEGVLSNFATYFRRQIAKLLLEMYWRLVNIGIVYVLKFWYALMSIVFNTFVSFIKQNGLCMIRKKVANRIKYLAEDIWNMTFSLCGFFLWLTSHKTIFVMTSNDISKSELSSNNGIHILPNQTKVYIKYYKQFHFKK